MSITLGEGEIVGLIGPNGAGKTTCVNVMTGFQAPTTGTVGLDGEDISSHAPFRIRRQGLARTFQAGRLFTGLDLLDNLAVTGVGLGYSRRASEIEAQRLLKWFGLEGMAGSLAAGLPYTDERRVSIARSLMFEPKYLLLDEPAAGMSAKEADELSKLIKRIASDMGTGVILIEHNVGMVLSTCSNVVVLDGGKVIEEGSRDVILGSHAVREAYLGADQDDMVASHTKGAN
ncbi:ABC transporter ATP-binding protein [Pararhodobacter sp.]|uniref:ABC transporter ATP-binding protein n=1 Tax=Pararhodobacter sp. TaxID=2127056 RepID=UPI002AFE0F3A|nr:ATP-binding cassette domain-containing protein [Pararhodobacter sp.]